VAAARIFLSVLFAVSIGMIISKMFHEQEETPAVDAFVRSSDSHDIRRLVYLFSVLIGILLVGTRVSVPWIKLHDCDPIARHERRDRKKVLYQ